MPNIREYSAQPGLGFRPTETGVEATAGAARRIGGFYNQAGSSIVAAGGAIRQAAGDLANSAGTVEEEGRRLDSSIRDAGDAAVKYVEHQEVSHGAAGFAGLTDGMTKTWNATVKGADPNDTGLAARFIEGQVSPALEKFREGFVTEGGQRWAEAHIDALRTHMFEKTSADMSTLAGDAVAVNHRQVINGLSNTVHDDPSSLDFSLKALESSTTALVSTSPNLSGADAARLNTKLMQEGKEAIVKSAVMGAIEKNPDAGMSLARDPRYSPYVNGQEIKQFEQAQRYYNRVQVAEGRAARVQRDYEAKNDFNRKANELELTTIPQNVGEPPQLPKDYWDRIRDLGNHPGAALEPGRLKTMVTNGEAITDRLDKGEPLAKISHGTTMEMLGKIRSGDVPDTGPIYEAYGQGKLNRADFGFLTKEVTNLKTPEGEALGRDRDQFFKRFSPGIADPLGPDAGKLYLAEMDARRQESDLRKKGLDPHLVYDPRSEYFFGKPANLIKYKDTLQNLLRQPAASPEPAAKPIALPPMSDRKAGTTYPTPRGPKKWTGTGWVDP